jgi:hypothetical protein
MYCATLNFPLPIAKDLAEPRLAQQTKPWALRAFQTRALRRVPACPTHSHSDPAAAANACCRLARAVAEVAVPETHTRIRCSISACITQA